MKVLILILSLFVSTFVLAQGVCTVDSQYTQPGLYPLPDSLPCIAGGGSVWNDFTVQFVMFDSADVSGFRVRVEYVTIEEILNLPCGINWSTSKQNAATPHRFENQERGCIRFWGTTNDPAGQYKLVINVKAKVSLLPGEVPYNAEDLGFRVDVRVRPNPCLDSCPGIDTTASAVLLTASCGTIQKDTSFSSNYTGPSPCTGINEIADIKHFSLYPNPAYGHTSVSFTADKPAAYTSRIINIYGQEVHQGSLDVVIGLNVDKLDVSQLAAGVYIYTLSDGKSVLTQRFVVE